jgi:hypothetical protein
LGFEPLFTALHLVVALTLQPPKSSSGGLLASLPHVRSRTRSLGQSLRPVRAGRACCGERGCSPFAHFDRPPPMHPVRVNSMKKPRPCRPPSVPPTPVVTPRASLSRCRPISDVRCRSTGRPNRFSSTGPSSRRATTSRCASHAQPASPGARVSRPVLEDEPDCAPNAFRRSSVLTRAFSRQCISALTRPGFTSKIPHPFHSRACFPTYDPVEEPYASRELARPVLKGSLSKASSGRSYRHVVSTSAAHLHSFVKDEHPRLAGDRFRPGLAPISPRWSCSFHGEPPRERRAGDSNTRALSSLAPGLRPNLSTSRRAPGRSACRPPSQRRLARSPRAPVSLTRCPEPGRLQPMRLLSKCLCAGSRPPDDRCVSR